MRIGVVGCAGRMGRAVMREVLGQEGAVLAGGIEAAGNPCLGQDLGVLAGGEPSGTVAGEDSTALAAASDVLVEFSSPAATLAHAAICAERGCAHVIGTTGLDAAEQTSLAALATRIPIVWSANMSQGVNLLAAIVEQVARALDPSFDIEVLEMHHRHKVDAPSGTALMLGRAAAAGRGIDLGANAVRARDGHTGPRPPGSIGFATLRGGDVVGDHSVIFAGVGERIVVSHLAADRGIYAKGAVRAALWTRDRSPGLYAMIDVLGMRPSAGAVSR